MDVYDRLQPEDLMKNAVIIASFVYHAANRDALLPRKALPAARAQHRLPPSRAQLSVDGSSGSDRRCRFSPRSSSPIVMRERRRARQLAEARDACGRRTGRGTAGQQVAAQEVERQSRRSASTQALLDKADQQAARRVPVAGRRGAATTTAASFFDLAKTSFDGRIGQPIARHAEARCDDRLGEAERERASTRIARLTEQVAALGSTASTLSRALRTPAVRGRWGEMQLRRVVEIAGMLQRCDFDEQPAL